LGVSQHRTGRREAQGWRGAINASTGRGADLHCKVLEANRDGGFDAAAARDNEAALEHALHDAETEGTVREREREREKGGENGGKHRRSRGEGRGCAAAYLSCSERSISSSLRNASLTHNEAGSGGSADM
jgi:hypothetical protein